MTLKIGKRSLKVIKNSTIQYVAYESLLAFHGNYGPIMYHFHFDTIRDGQTSCHGIVRAYEHLAVKTTSGSTSTLTCP